MQAPGKGETGHEGNPAGKDGEREMRAFCTGISGSDKVSYIGEAIVMAGRHGHEVEHFQMGDRLLDEVKRRRKNFNLLNILNVSEDIRGDWVSTVFERVMKEAPGHAHSIISTHAVFLWKNVFSRAIDTHYVKLYDPDVFITFIDNTEEIKKRLDANPQWMNQQLTIDAIEMWQNVEVEMTRMLADLLQKPHYVLPRKQPPDEVFKTLFMPELPSVYVSFPMSNLKDERIRREIDGFVEELRSRFKVITPRAIELGSEYSEVAGAQTVHRDLHWFIRGTDITIVYYALNVRSTGVDKEVKEAFENGKEVLMIDSNEKSPFVKHYAHAIFPDKEKLYEFLDKQGYVSIKKGDLYELPPDAKERYKEFAT